MSAAQSFRVLGPAEAWIDGRQIPLPGAKPRAVLAMLALNTGATVAAAVLNDVLWGPAAPRTASKALLTHVSTLRHALGEGAIVTSGTGWRLTTSDVDAAYFTRHAEAGRHAFARGATTEAVAEFRSALELWRGPPVLPDTVRGQAERTRWVEAHESVVDDLTDARLASGEHSALVGELEASLAANPLRERRWAQLCLALYRSGRQGDALAAYQRARAELINELGLEPGPDLVRLERKILDQDSTLDTPSGASGSQQTLMPHPPDAVSADQRARPVPPEPTGDLRKHPARLPSPLTTFVGRRRELQNLVEILADHRMVTITGPGGVGKSRLAIAAAQAVAHRYGDRVWHVDLSHAAPGLVAGTVAGALGVSEQEDRTLDDAIADRIADEPCLLVLDNCVRVRHSATALLDRLLAACPHTVILATSRERLGLDAERVVPIPPMSVSTVDSAELSDAEILFLERAREVDPTLEPDPDHLRQVCQRCDGLPLAIELAAARCGSLGMDGLLAGLDDRLRLLVGSHAGTERHRSLRAVLDWSHDVLDEDEKVSFRRLGAFAGRFDIDAAVAVDHDTGLDADPATRRATVVDLIGRLTDKNLLTHERTPAGSRWRMLDVVRSYARERLRQAPDAAAVQERYLSWAAQTAERLEQQLLTGRPWQQDFAYSIDDLRAALATDSDTWPDPADRLALALALARLHARQGSFTLAQLAYEQAVTMARKTGDAGQLARAALGASEPGMLFGVTQERRVTLLEEALGALDDEGSGTRVRLTARLATELYWSADLRRSLALAHEAAAAANRIGDPGAVAHATYALHYVTRGPGSLAARLRLTKRISQAAVASNETQLELAGLAAHVAALIESGDMTGAAAAGRALSAAADRLHHPEFQWYVSVYRLVQALITGEFDEADQLAAAARQAAEVAPEFTVGLFFAEAVTDLRERTRSEQAAHADRLAAMAARFPRIVLWQCLVTLSEATGGEPGTVDDVRQLTEDLVYREMRDGHWLTACCVLAEAAATIGDLTSARMLLPELEPYADDLAVAGRVAAFRGSVSYALGLLSHTLGDDEAAARYLLASAQTHERIGATPFHARDLATRSQLSLPE